MTKLLLVPLFLLGIAGMITGQFDGHPGCISSFCFEGHNGVGCCMERHGKRDVETKEERAMSCRSDCSCQAYFGECCETVAFYLKYLTYVVNFGYIPDHITEAEWRSAYPQFQNREQLQQYFNRFTWPSVPPCAEFGCTDTNK